jgi:hypothetical protein
MSVYFIKKKIVTYIQAMEHLAQAQRKKKKKKSEIRARSTDHKLPTRARTLEATPQDESRLLAPSNATRRSSRSKATLTRGSTTAKGAQRT